MSLENRIASRINILRSQAERKKKLIDNQVRETTGKELQSELRYLKNSADLIETLQDRLQRVEEERDRAVELLKAHLEVFQEVEAFLTDEEGMYQGPYSMSNRIDAIMDLLADLESTD